MTGALHDDELSIDLTLVRALVDLELSGVSQLELRPLPASGSSNALFRLGEELLVRLPRQPGGTATIEKEARWLPWLASRLPVAVPEVVHVGEPGLGYPERWSVVRWMPGETPPARGDEGARDRSLPRLATDLAALVGTLRRLDVPAPARTDPQLRWYRGDPLALQDPGFRAGLEACRLLPGVTLDLDAALEVWESALRAPSSRSVGPDRWYHGDLVAENLLVRRPGLVGLLDLGGVSVGEPTVDLVVAWEVLDAPSREEFRSLLGIGDDEWLRGRAWALALAMMTFPYYGTTMPDRCADRLVMGRAAIRGD